MKEEVKKIAYEKFNETSIIFNERKSLNYF